MAQSQEGTEEVTPWTSKEDSGCKGRDCDVRQCWGADLAARSRKHCILEPRVWRQTGRTQVSVLPFTTRELLPLSGPALHL